MYIYSHTQTKRIYKEVLPCILPEDFTFDIPPRYAAWLYKYHMTSALIKYYNIGFSASMGNRIILPNYVQDKLVGWQGRKVGDGFGPKYLSAGQKLPFYSVGAECDYCVFVEDQLSAIRVGEVTQACAVLGNYLPVDYVPLWLLSRKIILWLDDDKGGYVGLRSLVAKLRMLGCKNFTMIRNTTGEDPKFYSKLELTRILNEHGINCYNTN